MMKEEFEARFGCEVSPAVYARIEQCYLTSDDVNKDAFVKRCKKENLVVKIQQDLIGELLTTISEIEKSVEHQMGSAQEVLSDDNVKTKAVFLTDSMTIFGRERPELDAYRRRMQAQATYLFASDVRDWCHKTLRPFWADLFRMQHTAKL